MKTRIKKIITFVVIGIIFNNCIRKQENAFWIQNVNIINVKNGSVLANHNIKIADDVIVAIKKGEIQYNGKIIDGNNGFVIPGLWDMHVHLDMIDTVSIPLFMLNGVIGVRDMGGNTNFLNSVKKEINELHPIVKTAGAIIESPQFYKLISKFLGKEIMESRVPFSSASNSKKLIDSLLENGSDFIKIRTVENHEAFKKLANSARERGVKFTGHISPNLDILSAVKLGLSTIEHSDFFSILSLDTTSKENLAKNISNESVYYTPTIITTQKSRLTSRKVLSEYINDSLNLNFDHRKYLSPKLIENWMMEYEMSKLESPMNWMEMTDDFFQFGRSLVNNDIDLLSGTDSGVGLVIPGISLHQELEYMVKILRVSNLKALQSATINATDHLAIKDQGIVAVGYKANLLILASNPLENISNTKKIISVIKNGKVYDETSRKEILNGVHQKVNKEMQDYRFERIKKLRNSIKIFINI